MTVSLTHSKAVLELGKRLVAQLGAGDDLLASWMAHDIAQKIEDVEKASAETKIVARDACAKAILEVWRYRGTLPEHLRPLGELEPVIRTLASLDVDRTDHRYYPQALREAATASADGASKEWLELATGLDYTARLLIQFALRSAAHHAASEAEPWIELATQAAADEGAEGPVVKIILERGDATEGSGDEHNAALRDKLARLEGFAELAASRASDLRAQLGSEETEIDQAPK
jgi:hypothetical protein